MTQAELKRVTGLSAGAISTIVSEFLSEGTLERNGQTPRGAPLRFARRAGLVVGMDLDHRRLRVLLADQSHTVLGEAISEIDVDHDASEAVGRAREVTDRLLANLGATHTEVVGVGVGIAGPIDSLSGEVASSSVLPGWVGVRPGDAMEAGLGLPVVVDNSANLGALGEALWGIARGVRDLVFVQVGSGIGAGLILSGRIYRGAYGTAGEIGHSVVDDRGLLCRCGSRGCLETVAGLDTLLSRPQGGDLTSTEFLSLVARGDIGACRLVAGAGDAVGAVVATLCNQIGPQLVVIGGELAATGAVLVEPLRRAVERLTIESIAQRVTVQAGQLGDRAEALGAVALALCGSEGVSGLPRIGVDSRKSETVHGATNSVS